MSEEIKGKKEKNTGFVKVILVIIAITLIIVGAGIFIYKQNSINDTKNNEKQFETNDDNDEKDDSKKEDNDKNSNTKDNVDYIIDIEEGKELSYDIDGDGKKEKMKVDVEPKLYEEKEYKFLINDEEVFKVLADAITYYSFFLIDFDDTDGKYQIGAYTDWGTGDEYTQIFEWDGKSLISIKDFNHKFTKMDLNYDKTPGKTRFNEMINALNTSLLVMYAQYDKSSSKFNLIESEDGIYSFYKITDSNGEPIYDYWATLKKDLKVYEKCEDDATTFIIKAQNIEEIYYCNDKIVDQFNEVNIVSDYWVYLLAKDGTKGWMKVERTISDEKKINGEEWENYFDIMHAD